MPLTAEVQTVVDTLREPRLSLSDLPLDRARDEYIKQLARTGGAPVAMAEVDDSRLALNGRELSLRCYRPEGLAAGPAPTLVYFHGGGWVLGNLESHDRICRQLAARAHCQIIAVDYRLAPEHRLPAASDDAIEAFSALVGDADRYAIDPKRLAVGGDSAGGHLSAVVALAAHDAGWPLALQVLVYPVTDLRPAAQSYPARRRNAAFPPLTGELMDWFGELSLAADAPTSDWRISPLMAESLAGVAPALMVTAGADLLMDDGVLYAGRLRDAGIDVEHAHFPGVIHGFLEMHDWLNVTSEAMDRVAEALRTAFR